MAEVLPPSCSYVGFTMPGRLVFIFNRDITFYDKNVGTPMDPNCIRSPLIFEFLVVSYDLGNSYISGTNANPIGLRIFYVTDGNIMYLTDASRFLICCVIQHYAPVVGWGGGGGWRNRCIMLIMSLDPNWRPGDWRLENGIEPGSPASQAGTLPKELSRQLIPVLRIRDVYPRSRILIFSHPGSWIQNSTKERGEKKLVAMTFYVLKNFTELQIISVLNC
jgi:hypothetical protein